MARKKTSTAAEMQTETIQNVPNDLNSTPPTPERITEMNETAKNPFQANATDVTPTPVIPQQVQTPPVQTIPSPVQTAVPVQTIPSPVQTAVPVQSIPQTPQIQVPQTAIQVPTAPQIQTPEFSASMDVTFDSDIKLNVIEKLPEMSKDECARIAIVSLDTNGSPLIKMTQQYYLDLGNNQKLNFLVPKNKDLHAKIMQKYGEPKFRFLTIVIKYYTDRNGTVMKNAAGYFDYTFHIWTFSTDKWPDLKQMHQKWGLQNHDIAIQCKDQQFQKFNMVPEPDCYWKMLPNAGEIAAQGRAFYEQSMKKFMAKEIPDMDLAIKLGFQAAPALPNPVSPFTGPQVQMAQQVGAPATPFAAFVKPAS